MFKLFHRHKWTKWKDIESGQIYKIDLISGKKVDVGSFITQQRECSECGKKQLRQTTISLYR